MAIANPTNANKKMQAVNYYRAGDLRNAYKFALEAAEMNPRDTVIRNLAGAIANEIGAPSSAVKVLSESLEVDPHQANAHYLIGNAFAKLQLHDQAIVSFESSLRIDPSQPDALLNKGLSHRAMQDFSEAERSLRVALEINPDHAGACNALALILTAKNRVKDAEAYAERAVQNDPSVIEYVITYANILQKLRRFEDAEQVFRSALSRKPNDPTILCELGSVLRAQRRFDDATAMYEKAIEIAPRSKSTVRAAAEYFRSAKMNGRAIELYRRFIEIADQPDAALYNNLAIALRESDQFDEAEEMYLEAAKLDKNNAYAFNNLAILSMEMAKGPQSIEYYEKAVTKLPSYHAARSNMLFYMNYLSSFSPAELYAKHLEWGAFHTDPPIPGEVYHPNDPDPERKLKVGFVSADFCGHAVSYFIESPLQYHDKDNFEYYCYAAVPTPDLITQRLEGYVEHFRYIHTLTSEEVADLAREDGIDILVDLSGHTAGCKLEVFAKRPAPVQVTWIGYPNTTGIDAIDYRIVDSITDPAGPTDELHTEKLYRLPRCFTCYTPTAVEPVNPRPPVLDNGYITFGSFNNASKISDATLELWAGIMNSIDGSRLILKSASLADVGTQERIHKRFKDHGIDASRIDLHGRLPSKEHMRFYDNVDIGLDPTPYNGTTTTCEAMWMGVPVLALLGDRHAARVTASLMTNVGLGGLVAETPEGLGKIAAELAADTDRLTQIRETLRDQMKRSALCDGPGHARETETAFREMWRTWCADAPRRMAERRDNGWPSNESFKPEMPILNGFGNTVFLQLMRCLGAMKGIALLSDMHPLGMNIFPPLNQARDWWGLVDPEEAETWSGLNYSFLQIMTRLHLRTAERGDKLVLRSWSHLDFIGTPFLPAADRKLWTDEVLSSRFTPENIFVVSHPVAQWSYYVNQTTIASSLTLQEFLRGYRSLASYAAETEFLKIEDFGANPEPFLKSLCERLGLTFDPDYADNWVFNDKVSGLHGSTRLVDRVNQSILPAQPAHISAEERDEMLRSNDFREIVELLGYDSDYPVEPAP